MPRIGRWPVLAAILLGVSAPVARSATGDTADLAARVILLANARDPDSTALARYYAEKRNVPAANIVALPMSADETVGWPEFIATIEQPLQDWLVGHGWIDAMPTALIDPIGRRRYGVNSHRISYLVVCRGVPLRVSHEPRFYLDEPRLALRPEFRTNQGAVDSELTLLAHGTYNINGWVPNPLYQRDQAVPFEAEPVVKVTRLDGPDAAAARGLVDRALEAERHGLIGRYHVDRRGPNPDGEQWLDRVAAQLAALGYDGDVNRAGGTLPAGARADALAWYFGWYAPDLNGAFALPGFRFAPGAIALPIHSFSAQTLRSDTAGWCGPLVARGVTATFGNVFEPYLQLTLQPQLLLQAFARGLNLGDAAFYAEPALSWQCVVLGDPLYRPLAVSLDEQLARRAALPPALEPYAVVRRANLLERAGRAAEARSWLQENLAQAPGLVIALALAPRLEAAGDRAGARRALEAVPRPEVFPLTEAPLAQEAARLLAEWGGAPRAVALDRAILRNGDLPGAWRAAVLREAIRAATAAGERDQAAAWASELAGLAAPG